jgi:hypothetical protein
MPLREVLLPLFWIYLWTRREGPLDLDRRSFRGKSPIPCRVEVVFKLGGAR